MERAQVIRIHCMVLVIPEKDKNYLMLPKLDRVRESHYDGRLEIAMEYISFFRKERDTECPSMWPKFHTMVLLTILEYTP